MHDLTRILNAWPLLTGEPGTRRPRPPRRDLTHAEQVDRYVEWMEERREVELGIHGRGASPAPCDLDQLLAAHRLTADLCSLADRIAQTVQPAAPPSRVIHRTQHSLVRDTPSRHYTELTGADPNRWDYTWRHGAPWACLWLLGAVERGLPALLEDDVASTAASVLRGVYAAIDGQDERYTGRCPCGATLTVAPGDDVITCGSCREARGRDDWWMLTAAEPPERIDTRPPLIDGHERELRARWTAA